MNNKKLLCFMKCWSILPFDVCCGVHPSQHEREREQDHPDNIIHSKLLFRRWTLVYHAGTMQKQPVGANCWERFFT